MKKKYSLVCMAALAVFFVGVHQVYADEPVNEVKTEVVESNSNVTTEKASTPQLDSTIESVKNIEGVTVVENVSQNLGVIEDKPEEKAAKQSEAEKLSEIQSKEIEEKVSDLVKENEQIKAQNEAELEREAKEKAIAEENKNKDGFTKETISKHLVFGSSETSKATLVSVSGETVEFLNGNELDKQVVGGDYHAAMRNDLSNLKVDSFSQSFSEKGSVARLKLGQTATVRYENLMARYDDIEIPTVEYQYTVVDTPNQNEYVNFIFLKNPTETVYFGASNENTRDVAIRLVVYFYDKNGNEVLPKEDKPFYYSVASLNSYGEGSDYVEFVRPQTGQRFIKINGSYVDKHGYEIYSDKDIEHDSNIENWDRVDSPIAYVGAGILESPKRIELIFGVKLNQSEIGLSSMWFAFNTDFKAFVPKLAVLQPLKTLEVAYHGYEWQVKNLPVDPVVPPTPEVQKPIEVVEVKMNQPVVAPKLPETGQRETLTLSLFGVVLGVVATMFIKKEKN